MYFCIVCELHHLKIVSIVYRHNGNLKCQEGTDKEQQLKKSGESRNTLGMFDNFLIILVI